jgi:EAL domain-containing protein (putative c-di-GMP-specific phosphodiesterase class I)
MATLRELGCERAQGYLLGRPATAPMQTAFLTGKPLPETIHLPDSTAGAGAA